MKKHFTTIILIAVFLTGLSLLLYPTVSDWWNSFHQTRAIATYTEAVANLNEADSEKLWNDAVAYNEDLKAAADPFHPSAAETERYNSLLDVAGNGVMGSVEIPAIHCELPFYHGTDEGVLQIAVGHLQGTSLPVGGPALIVCFRGIAVCLRQSCSPIWINSKKGICFCCVSSKKPSPMK